MSAPGGPGQCWQWSPVSRLTGHQWNQLGLNWLLETLRAFLVSEARRSVHSALLRLSGPIVPHLMLSHNTIIDPSSPLSSVSVSVQSAHNHYQRSAISLITWVWDLRSNVISIWAWPEKILMDQSGVRSRVHLRYRSLWQNAFDHPGEECQHCAKHSNGDKPEMQPRQGFIK